jgi:hypothetical protein
MQTNLIEIGKIYSDVLSTEDDPGIRQGYIDAFDTILRDSTGNVITPQQAESMRKTTLVKSDLRRLERDAGSNPDEARKRLTQERDTYYPSLSEEDYDKGMGTIDKIEYYRQKEVETMRKQIYTAGLNEAKEGFRTWKTGKNKGFEQWLNDKWEKDEISDQTWNMFSDKIFMQKESWSHKMTPEKWKVRGELEGEILKSESMINDVYDLANNRAFAGLPESSQNYLYGLVVKNVPVKNAVKSGLKMIRDSFNLSGYSATEKFDTEASFNTQIEGMEKPSEIIEVARKIANDVGGTGTKPTATKEKQKTGKDKKAKVFIYNSKTGTFE